MSTKRGRLSAEEREYIANNCGGMTAEEISSKLGRTVETVTAWMNALGNPELFKEKPKQEDVEKITIRQELRATEAWKNLKKEFMDDELRYFEESYLKLMRQFKNDVFASEETQVFQVVKYEILMHRNIVARRVALEDIERLTKMQNEFLEQHPNPMERDDDANDYLVNLESQIIAAKRAEADRTSEYVKLQEKHDKLLERLKGVRDQRVKDIETDNTKFLDVIKKLQNKDVQEREARQLELMKLAGKQAYKVLGEPHTFEDGNQDLPILSAETVADRIAPTVEDDEEEDDADAGE